MEYMQVSVIQRSWPKGMKPQMREHKLSSIYWQGVLKKKGVKEVG
jgi:hypothetical protein